MGKVSTPALPPPPQSTLVPSPDMNKPKKKKGRPSLKHQKLISPNLHRKSTRRNSSPESPSDDDDERQQKKVKLVVRLPQSTQQRQHSDNSSESGDDNPEAKSNNVNNRSGDDLMSVKLEENATKETDTIHGSSLGTGPPTPLLDKNLLVFILDRLQKKDTYGVFSEPVDPNELPDYHEIIKHPMDFGTVRRKLDAGSYSNLEQLEADVLLICSNAMQYNSSDTVYFRQARSIQELAKRDFENLRHEGDDGELRPKVVRRGRPPSKHLKKPPITTSIGHNGPETSALVTAESPALAAAESPSLATAEENTNGSSAYNLRRAPMSYKFQTTNGALSSHRSRNGGNYSEWLADWNDEFPGYILRADMKYGKKLVLIDETRRETYKQFHPSSFGHELSCLSDLGGGTNQLMPVGLHMEHSYARSVARFAANLGPVVWKIASKKLAGILPPGVKFGPGYVGEKEAPFQSPFSLFERQKSSCSLACEVNNSSPATPSKSGVNPVVAYGFQGKNDLVETSRRISCQNELAVSQATPLSGIKPGLSFDTPNKTVFHAGRNGLNGVSECSFPSQMGSVRTVMTGGHSALKEASQLPSLVPKSESTSPSALANHVNSEEQKCIENVRTLHCGQNYEGKQSWQAVRPHPIQNSVAAQPDLNVRLQAPGSPNSGFRVGSPQQPDLALQL